MSAHCPSAVATNQDGWTIERLYDAPKGWTPVLDEPFVTKGEADLYLADMVKVPGAEYRVYPSLKGDKHAQQ